MGDAVGCDDDRRRADRRPQRPHRDHRARRCRRGSGVVPARPGPHRHRGRDPGDRSGHRAPVAARRPLPVRAHVGRAHPRMRPRRPHPLEATAGHRPRDRRGGNAVGGVPDRGRPVAPPPRGPALAAGLHPRAGVRRPRQRAGRRAARTHPPRRRARCRADTGPYRCGRARRRRMRDRCRCDRGRARPRPVAAVADPVADRAPPLRYQHHGHARTRAALARPGRPRTAHHPATELPAGRGRHRHPRRHRRRGGLPPAPARPGRRGRTTATRRGPRTRPRRRRSGEGVRQPPAWPRARAPRPGTIGRAGAGAGTEYRQPARARGHDENLGAATGTVADAWRAGPRSPPPPPGATHRAPNNPPRNRAPKTRRSEAKAKLQPTAGWIGWQRGAGPCCPGSAGPGGGPRPRSGRRRRRSPRPGGGAPRRSR